MSHSPPDRIESENLVAIVASQAKQRPDACAVATHDQKVSYSELYRISCQVNALLRDRSVQPEEPVGVFMARTPLMLGTLLGVMQAGAAYVPIDPDDPEERNLVILKNSGCKTVITDAARESVSEFCTTLILEESQLPLLRIDEQCAPGEQHLAYILHTSGSTGVPKGVEVEHRSLLNLLMAAQEMFEFEPADRILAAATFGFDISVIELFLPLLAGGSLFLDSRNIWLDPARLRTCISQHDITIVQSGPSAWAVALDYPSEFPQLKVAISTAEAISTRVANQLPKISNKAWNLYGPTEATVWATGNLLNNPPDPDMSIIGMPIGGAVVRVRDANGKDLPTGTEGELWIGGKGIARGYRNNAPLTEDRFIRTQNNRWYKTGDLAQLTAASRVRCLGRIDDQMKIRGVRIEPGEIEVALARHPDVRFSSVTWYKNSRDSLSVVAAVVLRSSLGAQATQNVMATNLIEWVKPQLPSQMVPSRVVFLPSIPQTPNSKTDHQYIRDLVNHKNSPSTGNSGQTTPADLSSPDLSSPEQALAEIWSRTLGVETVLPDDNFFTIGGDSLSAVQMIATVEAELGAALDPKVLYEHPTLSALATDLKNSLAGSGKTKPGFIFPLVQVSGGKALFFHGANLRMAREQAWQVPCSLYAVEQWAQGAGFVKAKNFADFSSQQIKAIKSIQPEGPYYLAGFSFGGLAAYETAQQLRALGDEVKLLFLLDPMMPLHTAGVEAAIPIQPGGVRERALQILEKLRKRFYLSMSRGFVKQWIYYQLLHLHAKKPSRISTALLPKQRWPAFWFNARRLVRGYVAKPYHGRATVLFSRSPPTDKSLFDRRAREGVAVWRSLMSDSAKIEFMNAYHGEFWGEAASEEWMKELTKLME